MPRLTTSLLALAMTLVLAIGCVAPVLPSHKAPVSARADSWAEGSQALEVLTYQPPQPRRTTAMNNSSAVDALLLAGAVLLVAAWLYDGKQTHLRGQVVWQSGAPCSSCFVSATITNGDDDISVSKKSCNSNGYFHLTVDGDRSNYWVDKYFVDESVGGQQHRRHVIDFTRRDDEDLIIISN